ncbi:MAG: hypothetical protein ACKOJ7_04205 [Betaproteobacteria bacterium]
MSDAALADKFHAQADAVLGRHCVQALVQMCWQVAQLPQARALSSAAAG